MNFGNELNNYLNILNCSPKEFSRISGLSPTIISRYLNGQRTPRINSEYFNKIIDSLYDISKKKNKELDKESIQKNLIESINFYPINYNNFINNFNTILNDLKINTTDIAKFIGYDTSFISRIRNKTRKPADINIFINEVSTYIVKNFDDNESKTTVANIINSSIEDLNNSEKYKKALINWFSTFHNNNISIENFLSKLDNFNLNDYIKKDFDKIKIPTSPIILRNSKTYYGMEGRKQAEGDFLKTTLISKSQEPIFFYSNLPISKAGEDENFKQKWILAITMILKKGLHLNMVHNIDRPLNEMLLGLESWIPIYMTGSISPYYFSTPPSNLFTGTHCTSGSVAMSSECIKNNEEKSRFYVTTKKEELNYYKEKSKYLLSKAKPLMTIFKEKDKSDFKEFLKKTENSNILKIKKDNFKNIDFYINKGNWIIINKTIKPELHFIIHNDKLRKAIEEFLLK